MIESIADFGFKDLDKDDPDFWNKIDLKLKEKLNLGLDDIKASITTYVSSHAEDLALQLPNIAPNGDYGKLLEDNDDMSDFLKKETAQPENWILNTISEHDQHKSLISFEFLTKTVDDGKTLRGLSFVSKAGIIRHAFVSVNE